MPHRSSPPPSPGPHDRPSPAATPAPVTTIPSRALQSPSPTCTPPTPSPLSPDAEPFYPSGGRGKRLRWRDDSPSMEDEDQPRVSYRDVLLRPAASNTTATATVLPPAAMPSSDPPTDAPRSVRDRLGPRVDSRSGRHRQRRRGQTRLLHGLPVRRPDSGAHTNRSRLRSIVVRPQRESSPPLCDDDGFTRVQSRAQRRSARRRRQRRTQRQQPSRPAPPRRILAELAGRCLNCLSYKHLVAQCRLPTRCLRCHGFQHLARECKRPRSPVSTSSSDDSCGHQSPPPPPPPRRSLEPGRDRRPSERGRPRDRPSDRARASLPAAARGRVTSPDGCSRQPAGRGRLRVFQPRHGHCSSGQHVATGAKASRGWLRRAATMTGTHLVLERRSRVCLRC
ncbi:unnamed protein product [Urochloa humidicola]